MSNLTKYQPFTPEAYKRGRKASTPKSSYIRKIPVGQTRLRMLPTLPGELAPWVEIAQHWVEAPQGSGKRKPINCPQRMANKPCPLCHQVALWRNSGDPAQEKLADDMDINESIFANVIDRSCPEEGVKIFQMRPSILGEILDCYDAHGSPDFTDPMTGRDIVITRKGTGRTDTRYKVVFLEPSPLADSQQQIDQWIADAKPIAATYGKVLTPAQIAEVLRTGEFPNSGRNRNRNRQMSGSMAPQVGALAGQSPTDVGAPDVGDGQFSDDEDDNF